MKLIDLFGLFAICIVVYITTITMNGVLDSKLVFAAVGFLLGVVVKMKLFDWMESQKKDEKARFLQGRIDSELRYVSNFYGRKIPDLVNNYDPTFNKDISKFWFVQSIELYSIQDALKSGEVELTDEHQLAFRTLLVHSEIIEDSKNKMLQLLTEECDDDKTRLDNILAVKSQYSMTVKVLTFMQGISTMLLEQGDSFKLSGIEDDRLLDKFFDGMDIERPSWIARQTRLKWLNQTP